MNGYAVPEDEYPWLPYEDIFTAEESGELESLIREERRLRDILENGDSDMVLYHDRRGTILERQYRKGWNRYRE